MIHEVLEAVYSSPVACPLIKGSIKLLGRFASKFPVEAVSAETLAKHLESLGGRFQDDEILCTLVALCPKTGSLYDLVANYHLLQVDNPELFGFTGIENVLMEACMKVEIRNADVTCSTFEYNFGTKARVRRTYKAKLYDTVMRRILSKSCVVTRTKEQLQNGLNGLNGWTPPGGAGFIHGTYRLDNDILEIILDSEGDNIIPVEDISQVRSLVLYGHALKYPMTKIVKGIIQRTKNLKHFAAINVLSQEDSFDIITDADLPDLRTVIIDVPMTWAIVDVGHFDNLKDYVLSPKRMLNRIVDRFNRTIRNGLIFLFRHDLVKGDFVTTCSGDGYLEELSLIHI